MFVANLREDKNSSGLAASLVVGNYHYGNSSTFSVHVASYT